MTKKWQLCPTCKCMTYATMIGMHTCNKKVRAKMDAEYDFIMDIENSSWDAEAENFWDQPDVKYMIKQAKEGEI